MVRPHTMETATRLGFAARAIMYLVLGWFALRTGHGENGPKALHHLNSGAGKILLAVMALGFLGYGVWRISEALIDSEGHGSDAKGLVVRIGGAFSGLIHLGFSAYALKLATGMDLIGGAGGGGGTQKGAETALHLPGGPVLVAIGAGIFALVGAVQLVKAAKAGFLKHLLPEAAARDWVKWMGRGGYAARGIIFLVMGWTLWRAAQEKSAGQAADMGSAIDLLSDPVQTLVAAGMLLFGAYSGVEAIYRRITDPKVVDRLKTKLRQQQAKSRG